MTGVIKNDEKATKRNTADLGRLEIVTYLENGWCYSILQNKGETINCTLLNSFMRSQEYIKEGKYQETIDSGIKVINTVSLLIKQNTQLLYPFFEGRNGVFFTLCYNVIFSYIQIGEIEKAIKLKNKVIKFTDNRRYLDELFISQKAA